MERLSPLSRRYARALVELGDEQGTLDVLGEEVRAFRELLEANPDFRIFLESPGIDRNRTRELLEKVLRGRMSDTFVNFLLVIVRRGRSLYLKEMLEVFDDLYRQAKGQVEVTVMTATEIDEDLAGRTRGVIQERLPEEVILVPRADPRILGGMVIRYRDWVFDGSLRNRLERLRKSLLAAKLGSDLFHEN